MSSAPKIQSFLSLFLLLLLSLPNADVKCCQMYSMHYFDVDSNQIRHRAKIFTNSVLCFRCAIFAPYSIEKNSMKIDSWDMGLELYALISVSETRRKNENRRTRYIVYRYVLYTVSYTHKTHIILNSESRRLQLMA